MSQFMSTDSKLTDMSRWCEEIDNDVVLNKLVNKDIELKNGIYVKANDPNNIIVVPSSLRKAVYDNLHNNFGHSGIKRTTLRIRERYYWPNMTKEIKEFCKKCHLCAVNKDNVGPNNAPLMPMETSGLEPFERVAMDIPGPLPESQDGSKYLLVLQDYFTKWPEAVALSKIDSETIQNWIKNEIVPRYGVPNELITDQGVQFISNSFKEFCRCIGIKQKKTLTLPF